MKPLKRALKYYYYRFARLKSTPEEMALGVSIGLFVGFTPTFGVQSVVAVFVAAVFRGDKILAAAAAFVTNPVTIPFIYAGTYLVGTAVLQNPVDAGFLSQPSIEGLWETSGDIFVALWVGGVIVGLLVALLAYYVLVNFGMTILTKWVPAKFKPK
ncbi:MAG: DUF2062 domain-containing protein [Nitrospinales bacterium]